MSVSILEQEREVATLITQIPPATLGARIRRTRIRLGLSIRELSAAANVSKTSIVRLEQGGSPSPITVVKLCAAMGVHVAMIAKPAADESQLAAVHRHSDDRWFDLTDFAAGPVAPVPLTETERRASVRSGVKVPLLILSSRLESGRLLPTVIELYQESELRSHSGEEFVYVLNGQARIRVGSETHDLSEGESITFWSAEEHSYAPVPGSKLPARVLSVRIDDRVAVR